MRSPFTFVTTLLLTAAAIGAVNLATARAEGKPARERPAVRAPKRPLAGPAKLHGPQTRGELSSKASPKPAAKPTTQVGPLVRAAVASADDHDPDEDGPDEPGSGPGTASGTSRGAAPGGGTAAAGLPANPVAVARESMDQLARNLQHVQRIATKADRDTYTADCVAEKSARRE